MLYKLYVPAAGHTERYNNVIFFKEILAIYFR